MAKEVRVIITGTLHFPQFEIANPGTNTLRLIECDATINQLKVEEEIIAAVHKETKTGESDEQPEVEVNFLVSPTETQSLVLEIGTMDEHKQINPEIVGKIEAAVRAIIKRFTSNQGVALYRAA